MNLVLFVIVSTFAVSSSPANDGLDSLLQVQRERAGIYAERLFRVIDNCSDKEPNPEELSDLRFLIAYLPLSDLASVDGEALLENVKLAREAMNRFSWGEIIPEEVYRHFVLPHRVTQEPFVRGWRERFFEELTPRVEGLSMEEAALEVNHWCHEKATFKSTTRRHQDPLTTIRAGYGRCGEETILGVAALRSVGIPARSAATLFWPHRDNNHAWVEVWVDCRWRYLGACEPEPELDRAWFTKDAARTMLTVATAYGDYHGDEPVLKRYGRSTLLNTTPNYAPTRELELTLLNNSGQPAAGERIVFNLFNFGSIMPSLALETDSDGVCRLPCGKGNWLISTGYNNDIFFHHLKADSEKVILRSDELTDIERLTEFTFTPPPEPQLLPFAPHDSLFSRRLATEDSLREIEVWKAWSYETGEELTEGQPIKPDSELVAPITDLIGVDAGRVLDLLVRSRGNWGHLYRFLTGHYPNCDTIPHSDPQNADNLLGRSILLETLTDKDLLDFSVEALEDHFQHTTLERPLSTPGEADRITELDSIEQVRYKDYVVAPRIESEPSVGWREALCEFFRERSDMIESEGDSALIEWLRDSITVEDKGDRLGPPLSPDQTLALLRGTKRDIERLYVGLCRVRGIPARFDLLVGRLERWSDGEWSMVSLIEKGSSDDDPVVKGRLVIEADPSDSSLLNAEYFKDWTLQRWNTDHGQVVEFGYRKSYGEMTWPQELPAGLYSLTTGRRDAVGSVPVKLAWFEVEAGNTVKVELRFSEQAGEASTVP